jgi:hypothetical protein
MLKADPLLEPPEPTIVAGPDRRWPALLAILIIDHPIHLEGLDLRHPIGDELLSPGVVADLDQARELVAAVAADPNAGVIINPALVADSNWGRPTTLALTLRDDRIVDGA